MVYTIKELDEVWGYTQLSTAGMQCVWFKWGREKEGGGAALVRAPVPRRMICRMILMENHQKSLSQVRRDLIIWTIN